MALFYQHYEQLVGKYSVLYQHVETGLSALRGMPKALVTNKARLFTELLLDKDFNTVAYPAFNQALANNRKR